MSGRIRSSDFTYLVRCHGKGLGKVADSIQSVREASDFAQPLRKNRELVGVSQKKWQVTEDQADANLGSTPKFGDSRILMVSGWV